MMKLPVLYDSLGPKEKKRVREEYISRQGGLCMFCKYNIKEKPPEHILETKINTTLFPNNFFKYPIHLQHDHNTGWTEGAVHAYCNAIMWQYLGR